MLQNLGRVQSVQFLYNAVQVGKTVPFCGNALLQPAFDLDGLPLHGLQLAAFFLQLPVLAAQCLPFFPPPSALVPQHRTGDRINHKGHPGIHAVKQIADIHIGHRQTV